MDICDSSHLDSCHLSSLPQLVEGLYFIVLVCPRVAQKLEGAGHTVVCAAAGLDSFYEWSNQWNGTIGNQVHSLKK